MIDTSVQYDKYGRMRYHPDYHGKQGAPWTTTDETYLIAHYYVDGPEKVSLALERTILTVMERACQLRKDGRMHPPAKRVYTKRIPKPGKEPRT